jgi:DNA-binding CsgD family transcriptional regulator
VPFGGERSPLVALPLRYCGSRGDAHRRGIREPDEHGRAAPIGLSRIRVGIVEAEEIFRLGLASSLAEHEAIEVVFAVPSEPPDEDVAVLITSGADAYDAEDCATVVCGPPDARGDDEPDRVLGYLPRRSLTAAQLVAAVQAAAVGLGVRPPGAPPARGRRCDGRRKEVLRLLADGADTRAISRALLYSERTVKALIQSIEHELHARNRAHAVALAIREGLI